MFDVFGYELIELLCLLVLILLLAGQTISILQIAVS